MRDLLSGERGAGHVEVAEVVDHRGQKIQSKPSDRQVANSQAGQPGRLCPKRSDEANQKI